MTLTVDQLGQLAQRLATVAWDAGVRGVIVAVSADESDPAGRAVHSSFYVQSYGPCLEIEGLSKRVVRVAEVNWKGHLGERER